MQTKAAILTTLNRPLVIDEIEIPPLKPGQALVKIAYSGICHTQILEARGKRGKDPFLPHCLGHEGSGVVIEVGPEVTQVKPKDHVILSWIQGEGANVCSSRYKWRGKTVNAGAITTFSEYAVISENRLTPLPPQFSLKKAALLGCAIPTGLGAIFNTARPSPGQSLAVFGCGGIGLFAIQGAVISGCAPVIAIDINDDKLEAAKQVGAHYTINSAKQDLTTLIKTLSPLDHAIEASGSIDAMEQALFSVRPRGGNVVIIGNAHEGKRLLIDPKQLNQGKRLLGTWGGDHCPKTHYPRYWSLVNHKHLNLDPFTQKIFPLDEINQAMTALEKGDCLRPLVQMDENWH